MSKILEDALRATFSYIGQSVQFIAGMLGVVLVTALSLSGEILDDLTTYRTQPVDWVHGVRDLEVMIREFSFFGA